MTYHSAGNSVISLFGNSAIVAVIQARISSRPVNVPVEVLEVLGVLGEQVGPRIPVTRRAALRRDVAVVLVRPLHLVSRELPHDVPLRRRAAPYGYGRAAVERADGASELAQQRRRS